MFDDESLMGKVLMYRDWGRIGSNTEEMSERFAHDVDGVPYDFKFLYAVAGYNFKSTEMNAAFGCVQIRRVDDVLLQRRRLVGRYLSRLAGQTFYELPKDTPDCNWLAFPLLCGDRLRVMRFLEDNGVQVRMVDWEAVGVVPPDALFLFTKCTLASRPFVSFSYYPSLPCTFSHARGHKHLFSSSLLATHLFQFLSFRSACSWPVT